MFNLHKLRFGLASTMVLAISAVTPLMAEDKAANETPSIADQGKEIAFDRTKGNCLACHQIADGKAPGNIGPPLIAMKDRYPDKAKLRAQIWDSTAANPNTMMPPFGRHGILSDEEIDKVAEFIYSL
jgi:sulfur-oxidizing protein SoxX